MRDLWLERVKEKLKNLTREDLRRSFARLRVRGLIDENGNVTGKLRRWTAYLVVTEVRYTSDDETVCCTTCWKPVFGMEQKETFPVDRATLVEHLKAGKKIQTGWWDDDLLMWREGPMVRLTPEGFLRVDELDEPRDYLGDIVVNNALTMEA